MRLPLYTKTKTHVSKTLGVAAGKGGVGKSFVAANLARALNVKGFKVGLLDADLYGPSLKRILPAQRKPSKENERWIPAEAEGIKLLSFAHLCEDSDALSVRAPIASRLIDEFLNQTDWGELDYLVIDFPPGTGDIQMTLAQKSRLEGVFLVTTPQTIAISDVRRAARAFKAMNVPLIGLIENMSYFTDPSGQKHFPFGKGGGIALAEELATPLLATLPLDADLSRLTDLGFSLFQSEKESLKEVQTQFFNLVKNVSDRKETREIRQIAPFGPFAFRIEWADGVKQQFDLAHLQALCPCASCLSQPNTLSPLPSSVRAKGILEAGRYALKIDFETGCCHGIYTYEFLRQQGQPL